MSSAAVVIGALRVNARDNESQLLLTLHSYCPAHLCLLLLFSQVLEMLVYSSVLL